MLKSVMVFIGGALAGALAMAIIVSIVGSEPFATHTLKGPVAIYVPPDTTRGYLGVTFSNEPSRSLYVAEVTRPNSPGEPTIFVGDRLDSFNGQRLADYAALQELLGKTKPGDVVVVELTRDQQPFTINVPMLSYDQLRAAMRQQNDPQR